MVLSIIYRTVPRFVVICGEGDNSWYVDYERRLSAKYKLFNKMKIKEELFY